MPSPLVSLLKLYKLQGMPYVNIGHKTDTVKVTNFWKRATPADSKKKTTLQPSAKLTKPPTKSQQKVALKSPKSKPKPLSLPMQKIKLLLKLTKKPSQH